MARLRSSDLLDIINMDKKVRQKPQIMHIDKALDQINLILASKMEEKRLIFSPKISDLCYQPIVADVQRLQ